MMSRVKDTWLRLVGILKNPPPRRLATAMEGKPDFAFPQLKLQTSEKWG